MVWIVEFFRKEETLFHTNTEICDSFDLFSSFLRFNIFFGTHIVVDNHLRHPKWIHVNLSIFNDIVEH